MGKAIPDRWLPYSSVGSVIQGTRFICFKVPLRRNDVCAIGNVISAICWSRRKSVLEYAKKSGLQIDEMWDLETLLKTVPKLKYVIDLTNTNRYYDPRVLEAAGVEHVKIAMPGRVIPPENIFKLFSDTVERFLRRSDDGLIGVHCTHGLNRTGYMVCRYMRDKLGIPAATAIEIFEDARGYKIERDNYLADLQGAEPSPPNFGQDTVLKIVDKRDNTRDRGSCRSREDQHRSDGNSGRQREDRPSRYGRSGWRERDRTRSRSRERSPVRSERRQEHHERDRKQNNRNDKTRENGYKRGRRDGRFRRYSSESGHSNSSDYDFRYDY